MFKSIKSEFKFGTLNFLNNIFDSINISSIFSEINITLNANIGFVYCSNSNTTIDFETIHYNNKYIYSDGSKQITCKNWKGNINIYRQY